MRPSRGMGDINPKKKPNKHHKHKGAEVPHSTFPPVFNDNVRRVTRAYP